MNIINFDYFRRSIDNWFLMPSLLRRSYRGDFFFKVSETSTSSNAHRVCCEELTGWLFTGPMTLTIIQGHKWVSNLANQFLTCAIIVISRALCKYGIQTWLSGGRLMHGINYYWIKELVWCWILIDTIHKIQLEARSLEVIRRHSPSTERITCQKSTTHWRGQTKTKQEETAAIHEFFFRPDMTLCP